MMWLMRLLRDEQSWGLKESETESESETAWDVMSCHGVFKENNGGRESESGSETESVVGGRVGVRVVVGMNSHGVLRRATLR